MTTEPLTLSIAIQIITLIAFAVGVTLYISRGFAARDKDLAEHKLHAAETFATKAGVTESLDRVFNAIDKLTTRVDELLRIERKRDDP